jgi:hypothetical protein
MPELEFVSDASSFNGHCNIHKHFQFFAHRNPSSHFCMYLDSHVSGHDYAQNLHSNQNFAHKKRFQSTELTPLIYLKKYTNLQWYSPLDPLAPSAAIANTY